MDLLQTLQKLRSRLSLPPEAPLSLDDLTGADLRGADLTGADLRGANRNKAILSKALLCPTE